MKMYQVDAFTTSLFKGNPAAVIVQDAWLDDHLMQNIALENNLSETALSKCWMQKIMKFAGLRRPRKWISVDMPHWPAALYYSRILALQNHLFSCQRSGHFTVCQDEDGKIRMNFPIRQPELITDYPKP